MRAVTRPAVLLVALALLVVLVVGCRRPEDGTNTASIDVGGRERTYLYRLPPGHDPSRTEKWPLVIMLHGQFGTGERMEDGSQASGPADRHGFVVIYPDGVDRSWNDMRGSTKASEQNIDDVAFVKALIDRFIAERGVDPARVFVAGMSNGGMLAFRLACELSDRVTAVAAVAALMPTNGSEACQPSRGVPMMIFSGEADPIVPYGGGTVARDAGVVLSADETRARWKTLNGCTTDEPPLTMDPASDDTSVTLTRSTGCRDKADVAFYTVRGGGHTWPGGDGAFPEIVTGKTTEDVDATEEALHFFELHPR